MDKIDSIFWLTLVGCAAGVISAVSGLAQVAIQWWTLREIGDLDKTRTDWWERMEDSESYKSVARWLRFAMGRSNK